MVSKEVDIRSAKTMGGIGAILELVGGFIPYLGSVLPLAGSSSCYLLSRGYPMRRESPLYSRISSSPLSLWR